MFMSPDSSSGNVAVGLGIVAVGKEVRIKVVSLLWRARMRGASGMFCGARESLLFVDERFILALAPPGRSSGSSCSVDLRSFRNG